MRKNSSFLDDWLAPIIAWLAVMAMLVAITAILIGKA